MLLEFFKQAVGARVQNCTKSKEAMALRVVEHVHLGGLTRLIMLVHMITWSSHPKIFWH